VTHDRKPSWFLLPLGLLSGLATLVYFAFVVYQPDRPVATIVPGSSSGPGASNSALTAGIWSSLSTPTGG